MGKTTTITRTYVQPLSTKQTAATTPHKRVITPQQRSLIVKALLIWLAFTCGGWQWLPQEYLPIFSHSVGFAFFLQLITGKTRYLGIIAASSAVLGVFAYIYIQSDWIVLFGNGAGYIAITIAVLVITLAYNVQNSDSSVAQMVHNTSVNEILDDIRYEITHTFARVRRFVDSMTPTQFTPDAVQPAIVDTLHAAEPVPASPAVSQHTTPMPTLQPAGDTIDSDTLDLETQQPVRRERSSTDVDLDDIRGLKVLITQLKDALLIAEKVSLDNRDRIEVLEAELKQSHITVAAVQQQLTSEVQAKQQYEQQNKHLQQQLAQLTHDRQMTEQHAAQLRSQLNSSAETVKTLTYKLRTADEQHSVAHQVNADKLHTLQKQMTELRSQYTDMHNKYSAIQQSELLLRNDKHQLAQQLQQLQHDNTVLRTQVQQLTDDNTVMRAQQQRKVITPIHYSPVSHSMVDERSINLSQSHAPLHTLFSVHSANDSQYSLFSQHTHSANALPTTGNTPTGQ